MTEVNSAHPNPALQAGPGPSGALSEQDPGQVHATEINTHNSVGILSLLRLSYWWFHSGDYPLGRIRWLRWQNRL